MQEKTINGIKISEAIVFLVSFFFLDGCHKKKVTLFGKKKSVTFYLLSASKLKMKYKEDSEYILAIKNGDKKAFGTLVQKHQSYAYTLAIRILKNQEDAQEVAQDSFIKIFHHIHEFQEKSTFKTWLYKIVYHEALGVLRKKKRQFVSIEDFHEDHLDQVEYQSGLDLLEENERKTIIRQALHQLKPAESAILTLYYLDEQSIKEIEDITNFTESNIKILLHRGRKSLVKELNKTHHKETIKVL